MPYIDIRISGSPDDVITERVASAAVELTSRILGKDPTLTAVVIDWVPAAHWFVGGKRLAGRSYFWAVDVTDETNTKTEKATYLAAVHETMNGLLGGVADHSYVHVIDARAAAYGFGGRTQESRYQRPG